MARYSIEQKKAKHAQGYGFLSFAIKLSEKYGKQLLDASAKTGLDVGRTASGKVVHKTAEAIGKLIENKITEKTVEPKSVPKVNSRSVEK